MNIYVYDENIYPIEIIDEIMALIWTKRYWSSGEFKLLVPFRDKYNKALQKYSLIYKSDDDEMGIVTDKRVFEDRDKIEKIEVTGRFFSYELEYRHVVNPLVRMDNTQNIVNILVNQNAINPVDSNRKIPLLYNPAQPNLGSGVIDFKSEVGLSTLQQIETLCKYAKLGFKVETDIKARRHNFILYKGADKTAGQTILPPCTFSKEFDNVLEQEFSNNINNLRTMAYVYGQLNEDGSQLVEKVGNGSGRYLKEFYVNAGDIGSEIEINGERIQISESEQRSLLRQKGYEELEKHTEALNFESRIDVNSSLIYKKDFNIGDRVTCVNKKWGVQIDVRITEVIETCEGKGNRIDITFGESLPSLTQKLRQVVG